MRLLVVLLTFLATSVDADDSVTTSYRVKNEINIRSAPDGELIGKLKKGAKLPLVSDEIPYFYEVRMPNGSSGFVAKAWTDILPSRESTSPELSGDLEIHFIDVGQGDSTLVVCPDGSSILVDAGSTSSGSADDVRNYIMGVLGPNNQELDFLVVTHADGDHYNMIPSVLRGYEVGHTYYVGYRNHYNSRAFWTWLSSIPEERRTRMVKTYFNAPDDSHPVMHCGEAEVFVLAAGVRSNSSWKNARSIVLMIRHGDFEAILTGDATHATEEVIMSRYDDSFLDVDLLKIGHHGSLATSTSEEWARVTKPKVAVASAARRNGYGHPREEVLNRLELYTDDNAESHLIVHGTRRPGQSGYSWNDEMTSEAIYTTSTSGNVIVRSNGTGYSVETVTHE